MQATICLNPCYCSKDRHEIDLLLHRGSSLSYSQRQIKLKNINSGFIVHWSSLDLRLLAGLDWHSMRHRDSHSIFIELVHSHISELQGIQAAIAEQQLRRK